MSLKDPECDCCYCKRPTLGALPMLLMQAIVWHASGLPWWGFAFLLLGALSLSLFQASRDD